MKVTDFDTISFCSHLTLDVNCIQFISQVFFKKYVVFPHYILLVRFRDLSLKNMVKYSAIYFLLFLIQVIHGQNTVCFDIEENPNANSTAFSNFTKYVRVLDCFSVYAESSISDAKVLHAAAVAAELLDNDEDGEVDDPLLKAELASNGALIPIFSYDGSPAMDNFLITTMVLVSQLCYGGMRLNQITLVIGESMPRWKKWFTLSMRSVILISTQMPFHWNPIHPYSLPLWM